MQAEINTTRPVAPIRVVRGAAICLAVLLLTMMPLPAFAADGFDGRGLSLWWALPFAGILLCIATGPVLYPHLWEHHFDKFALFWSACCAINS